MPVLERVVCSLEKVLDEDGEAVGHGNERGWQVGPSRAPTLHSCFLLLQDVHLAWAWAGSVHGRGQDGLVLTYFLSLQDHAVPRGLVGTMPGCV